MPARKKISTAKSTAGDRPKKKIRLSSRKKTASKKKQNAHQLRILEVPADLPVQEELGVPTAHWYQWSCTPRTSFYIGLGFGILIMGILAFTSWNIINAQYLWDSVQQIPTVVSLR